MLLSTILLIINFIALIYNGNVLFSFWWFLLIYPVEILLYIIVYIIVIALAIALGKEK